MSWEIDLFGSIRQRAKAKKELFRASRDEYNGTMVSLCAQVATAYMTLRTYQQQYIVAESNIQSQRSILHITEVRYETGLASQLGSLSPQITAITGSQDGLFQYKGFFAVS